MSKPRPLNEVLLPGNQCFGCSPHNPDGLRIKIFRDDDHADRLLGEYTPRETQGGFPHIVHGGLQFTALDCMAGWIVFTRGREDRLMPLTQSASVQYRRPVPLAASLRLSSELLETSSAGEGRKAKELLKIRTEIRDDHDMLLTLVDFDYVAVPEAMFRSMMKLEQLPESFRRHFGDA